MQYSSIMSRVIVGQRPHGRLSHSFAGAAAHDAVARTRLLDVPLGLVEDVRHQGACPTYSPEAFAPEFQVCLPYHGLFVWHVGRDDVVGDANQVVFVTGGEGYRISSPLPGGYAELIITPDPAVLAEAVRFDQADLSAHPLFRRRSGRADPRLQIARARFLHWADGADRDDLEAEEVVLALLRAALGDHTPCINDCGPATLRLIRRTKEFLEAELMNRVSLRDIGHAVGASPAYLTDAFRRAEGLSLHRYLMQLRLARALVELPHAGDLTTLALDLGFASHSHFSAVFRRAFGLTPSRFRERARCGACPLSP